MTKKTSLVTKADSIYGSVLGIYSYMPQTTSTVFLFS